MRFGGEEVLIDKKRLSWFIEILMCTLLLVFIPSPAVLYAEEKPLLLRDMLYTITDPSKASSTEILSFLGKEKKLKIGNALKIGKKAEPFTGGHYWGQDVLQSIGFPKGAILKESEYGASSAEKKRLREKYGNNSYNGSIYWTPLFEKNGSIVGFHFYPNHFFRANASFPEWGQGKYSIQMWLEPGILVIEWYSGNPEVIYLNANHPTIRAFLDLPCKTVFDRMQITMKERTDELISRFEAGRQALAFLEKNEDLSGMPQETALLNAKLAVVDLGIIKRLIASSNNNLAKNDRIWGEPIYSKVQDLSARLMPIAEKVFKNRQQQARAAADAGWPKALEYISQPFWAELDKISQVSPEQTAAWSESIAVLKENYKKYVAVSGNEDDLKVLSSRLEYIENIQNVFNKLRNLESLVSREVSYAVREMQMNELFYTGDDFRLLEQVISDGLRSEREQLTQKIQAIRERIEESRKAAIVKDLKENMNSHFQDPLSYVKGGRIFFEGYYTKELPSVGEAFRDGGASGDSSLTKVRWVVPPEGERYEYRVFDNLGIVYVHALVEGNAMLPGIDGGERRMQKVRLHLVRPLALEEGKRLLGQPPEGISEQEAHMYDLNNRVFVAELQLNRLTVPKERFDGAIRNLLFEVYDN